MVDLFDSTYGNFEAQVLARVRRKTFGEDFGQNSWTTADEYRRFAQWLELDARSHVLEVASGAGGPAIFLAQLSGARVTGIDINANGVAAATRRADELDLSDRVTFHEADASSDSSTPNGTYDAIVCVDSACHFPDRPKVLKEWHRILKPGGNVLFTDPVVVTGAVSNHELATRSSIGFFLFVPPGVTEGLIEQAGLHLIRREDVTENAAVVSKRWHDARAEDREALVRLEGEQRFDGLQEFFAVVHRLTSERRLSRFAYLSRNR